MMQSVKLQYEEFNLSDLFDSLYHTLEQKCNNTDVDFRIINPYESCMINLDKNRLQQLLTNFVTNAVKYTPSGHITMGYEIVDGGVRFYVEDTGIGIAKENHYLVFNRFQKFDSFAQGTGLGLAICKVIVENMKGNIGFKSEKGVGSLFWAWIPCNPIVASTINNAEEHPKYFDIDERHILHKDISRDILIAEDNDSNFKLVKAILKNYNITRAVNGIEAVDMASKNNYSFILMDMKMPVMGGVDAIKLIRKFNRSIPIIALTANAFDSDRKLAIDAGCDGFIAKPLSVKELENIIYNIVSNK